MKGFKTLITIILVCFFSFITILLINNKTFLTNYYEGAGNYKIFVPKYSYFTGECCMYSANFYSLKSKANLDKEINNYLDQFEYFENDETYGYKKDGLVIQSYDVKDHKLYRSFSIVYSYTSTSTIEK